MSKGTKVGLIIIGVIMAYLVIKPYALGCASIETLTEEEANLAYRGGLPLLRELDEEEQEHHLQARSLVDEIEAPGRVLLKYVSETYVVAMYTTGAFDMAGGLRFFYMPLYPDLYVFENGERVAKYRICKRVHNVEVRDEMLYFSWDDFGELRTGYARVPSLGS